MRREQSVALEFGEQRFVAFDFHMHQHNGVVWVGDEFFGDLVAAVEVAGDDTHGERVGVNVVEVVLEVALFFVEERFTVGEEQFHVASLRAVDGGVIDFVERAVRGGEPDFAGGCVSRGDGIFAAGSPARFETGCAEGGAVVVEPAIRFIQSAHRAYSTTTAGGACRAVG